MMMMSSFGYFIVKIFAFVLFMISITCGAFSVLNICLDLKDKGPKPKCDHCNSTVGVKLEDSRTQRYWNGSGMDPNSSIPYCCKCAEIHHEYWDAMWEEYNNSRG